MISIKIFNNLIVKQNNLEDEDITIERKDYDTNVHPDKENKNETKNKTNKSNIKLREEIERINLDKLFLQIPYHDNSEYKLLKIIRDKDVLHNAQNEIDSTYNNIVELYEAYKHKNKGYVWCPNYHEYIYIEIYKLNSFYRNNRIIEENSGIYGNIYLKAIEALIISYQTDDSCNFKLKEFNYLFFITIVHECKPLDILKLFERFQVTELSFDEQSVNDILSVANNFLESFSEDSPFENELIKKQLCNKYFASQCNQYFCNIFLVLSKTKLKEDDYTTLISTLIPFLQHTDFLKFSAPWTILGDFLFNENTHIKKDSIEDILLLLANKQASLQIQSFIHRLSLLCKRNNSYCISNIQIINNLIAYKDNIRNQYEFLNYLWIVSDPSIKEKIKPLLVSILENKFTPKYYDMLCRNKIINYSDYFDSLISLFPFNAYQGGLLYYSKWDFIYFVYAMKIGQNNESLKKIDHEEDIMMFFLFPEDFDYSKFKIEWLNEIKGKELFYNRFKKIPAIKLEIEKALRKEFNKELAEIYAKYFI